MARTTLGIFVLCLVGAAFAGRPQRRLLAGDTKDAEEVLVNWLLAELLEDDDCPKAVLNKQQTLVEEVAHTFFMYGYCALPPKEQYEQLGSALKYAYSKALQAYALRSEDGEESPSCEYRDHINDVMDKVYSKLDGESMCGDVAEPWAWTAEVEEDFAPAPAPALEE